MTDEVCGAVHFRERKVEGEGGLGSLILANAIYMEAIAAAAGGKIIERETEVVTPEEPLEGAPRLVRPPRILRRAEGLMAGGDHGLHLDGLLVEIRAGTVFHVEAIAADGAEMAGLCCLDRGEPAQRF